MKQCVSRLRCYFSLGGFTVLSHPGVHRSQPTEIKKEAVLQHCAWKMRKHGVEMIFAALRPESQGTRPPSPTPP